VRLRQLPFEHPQPRRRIAQGTGDEDQVSRMRTVATYGGPGWQLPLYLNADGGGAAGATGDQVAAHQRAVVVSRYRGKPCTEAFQPDVRLCAKPQPKSKAQGFGPHGSEVAEIDEQRALTQQIGVRT